MMLPPNHVVNRLAEAPAKNSPVLLFLPTVRKLPQEQPIARKLRPDKLSTVYENRDKPNLNRPLSHSWFPISYAEPLVTV